MNPFTLGMLEFDKVLAQMEVFALSEASRQLIRELKPSIDTMQIQTWMEETTQARAMLEINASVPLTAMDHIEDIFKKLNKSTNLTPDELAAVELLLNAAKRIRKYMQKHEHTAPRLASYALSMFELGDLRQEIEHCIVNGEVHDRASHELSRLRRRRSMTEERIKQKLNDIIRSPIYAGVLQEAVISERSGRYVIPVKRQHRKAFPGEVIDTSTTGSTVFMEPAAIARMHGELNELRIEEEREVYRILLYLTAQVEMHTRELSINTEVLTHYDFVFAKAKYSQVLDMKPVLYTDDGKMILKQARHPLLGKEAVPLDFRIGDDFRALLITGPNTGGKTVALKTVGLLCLMVQAGLHVPVGEGSKIPIFSDILVDIGDGQSIEQSLSTFSAHVKNLLVILACAEPGTLVIIDELGSGTDPAEGRGFAMAILEELYARGATIIATTHLGELKEFAMNNNGFENGSMEFDSFTLTPLYRLNIGTWGESQAFAVALRLGVEAHIIERAHQLSYDEFKSYSDLGNTGQGLPNQEIIAKYEEVKRNQQDRMHASARRERGRKYRKKDLKAGDSVYISSMDRTGIVCEEENERGELLVQVMGKKYRINNKRLSLHIEREQLYPEGYDLDIIFESKENRKKRKLMGKRHIEGLVIEKNNED